ncbi:unnamed protein product [Phytomonas sp. Hart1]|nr:unnamed protein product [Phytomonas sp. Hart1]|eukprot:CCW66959.1 unnamed protein product [Phytomonas sp. isolate Hart1]
MEILKKTAALRVQKQVGELQPTEVTDIALSGVPLWPTLITPFSNLVHLSLVFLKPKLRLLQSIPLECFPSLRLLNLSDNAITVLTALTVPREGAAEQGNRDGEPPNGEEGSAANKDTPGGQSTPFVGPSLRRLLLPNNCIAEMAEVKCLAVAFPGLEVLDLVDNPVDTPSHFDIIFELFPKLVALNSKDNGGCEVVVEDSDESSNDAISGDSEESSEDDSNDTDEEEDVSSNGTGYSDDSLEGKHPRLE